MHEVYYRYEEQATGDWDDDFVSLVGPRIEIRLRKYPVIKHTPRGVWIIHNYGDRKFILNDSRKRFACETKELAMESFIARKKRQAGILRAQLRNVEKAMSLAVLERDKILGILP